MEIFGGLSRTHKSLQSSAARESARRASAQVVKPPDTPAEVAFGTTVTIKRDDGRQQTWRIVGEDEADPAHGTLSHASPVARALMGEIDITGKLPISLPGLYPRGTGIQVERSK